MANPNGTKRNLRTWKVGQSGNPAGRPKQSPEYKALMKLAKHDLAILINKVLSARVEDLDSFHKNVLEACIASVIRKAIMRGDIKSLDFLLNRLFSKTEATSFESNKLFCKGDKSLIREAEKVIIEFRCKLDP